jgi:hypothetical protein
MRGSRATAGMRRKSNRSGPDESATEPVSPSRQATRTFHSSSLRRQGPSSHSRQWGAPLVAPATPALAAWLRVLSLQRPKPVITGSRLKGTTCSGIWHIAAHAIFCLARPDRLRSAPHGACILAGGFHRTIRANHQLPSQPLLVLEVRGLLLLPGVSGSNILLGGTDLFFRPRGFPRCGLNRLRVVIIRRGAEPVPRGQASGRSHGAASAAYRTAIREQQPGSKEENAFRNHVGRFKRGKRAWRGRNVNAIRRNFSIVLCHKN